MSKVIFKMRFNHPNRPDTISLNQTHLNYIATRPGTDKTMTEADLRKELNKGTTMTSDDESYVQYIDERPRSHGLFGADGAENPKDIQEEMGNHKGFIWRGIISLKEEDATNLGYLSKGKWQDMLRKDMPTIADQMGIAHSNLRWVGAVHMEKGHPHAHVMIWEKNPLKAVGVLSNQRLEKIRKALTDDIFEEERLQLLNEKNTLRDLINDLAKGDISNAAILTKEIREQAVELIALSAAMNQEGVRPRLYDDQERELAGMINELSAMLPGKGRAMLKFMPQNVKDEVRRIADHILKYPVLEASLENHLIATEKLTRLYTEKEDAITQAKENAYNDVRDRVGQVVLKGAVESLRNNTLYVDAELAEKAVSCIKTLRSGVDLMPEHTETAGHLISSLVRVGYTDDQIQEVMKKTVREWGIRLSFDDVQKLIENERKKPFAERNISELSSSKALLRYLTACKVAGHDEAHAFEQVRDLIDDDCTEIESDFTALVEKGVMSFENGTYTLTEQGVNEALKIKELDSAERAILKVLEAAASEVETKPVEFSHLIANKDIFSALRNRDPDEFSLGVYDARVRFEFGAENRISMNELEERIYSRNTDNDGIVNEEKAEQDFGYLKNRIEKLTLNGYVVLDKEQGIYSFSDKADGYFEYDDAKGMYLFTKEARVELGVGGMKFTRYDANVTLGYLDSAEGGILTDAALTEQLRNAVDSNCPDSEIEKQFKYLTWRLNNLKTQGILAGETGAYKITELGMEKRADLLTPQRVWLKKYLGYLDKLGLLSYDGQTAAVTQKYYAYMRSVGEAKADGVARTSGILRRDVFEVIDRTHDKVDTGKIQRTNQRILTGKFLGGEYAALKTEYGDVRASCGVPDTVKKVVTNLATTLMVSGVSCEDAKDILLAWNENAKSVPPDTLNELIDKTHTTIEENNLWGKITVVSSDDWKSMFKALGVDEANIPQWMYRGENWLSFKRNMGMSLISDLWKGVWRELESQRLCAEAQVEHMKKQLVAQSANKSKEAIIEQIQKNKSRTLYQDGELEQ